MPLVPSIRTFFLYPHSAKTKRKEEKWQDTAETETGRHEDAKEVSEFFLAEQKNI